MKLLRVIVWCFFLSSTLAFFIMAGSEELQLYVPFVVDSWTVLWIALVTGFVIAQASDVVGHAAAGLVLLVLLPLIIYATILMQLATFIGGPDQAFVMSLFLSRKIPGLVLLLAGGNLIGAAVGWALSWKLGHMD